MEMAGDENAFKSLFRGRAPHLFYFFFMQKIFKVRKSPAKYDKTTPKLKLGHVCQSIRTSHVNQIQCPNNYRNIHTGF